MIIDTHAHLYWDSFKEDYDEVIKRALDAGVTQVINIGVDIDTSITSAQMQNDQIKFYSSIGIHPHDAINYSNDISLSEDIKKLEQIYQSAPTKVVAVGECGLDFKEIDEQTKKLQRQLFQAQIDLAKKLNLPLIIHCRDDRSKNQENTEYWDEVIDLTKDHFGIYHCYSGLLPTTNYIIHNTNFLISFAGNITYPKNEYLREAAKLIPLERIVVETDCPFLPPQQFRGSRNEPAYITAALKTIAQVKNQPLEKVTEAICQNTQKILKKV